MNEKRVRPAIPDQVQRELWGRAAGRCEFRGCNKLLYKDELTQQRSNLAVISHIVSFSPDGPRGDAIRSPQLERDINNLMLTCRDHGKIIDDKDREDEYPESLLLGFKHEHEQRVRRVTECTEEAQTQVLLLQAPIDGHDVRIDPASTLRAILPKYPSEEHPIMIDLSGLAIPANNTQFFEVLAASITRQLAPFRMRRAIPHRTTCLSVFALAPIPLLVHFGHLLGDIEHVDLYQYHRDQQDWTWKDEDAPEAFYEVLKPERPVENDREIALVLSVSEQVNHARVRVAIGTDPLVYEIRARDPSRDFLRSRNRLQMFGYEVRKLLFELRDAHSHEQTIHLFASVPAPLAIELGRGIKDFDPPFRLYEYQKANRAFAYALTINAR